MPFKKGDPKIKGRVKGSKNKLPVEVKAMIVGALSAKGGQEYLERQADENPVAFMSLVGRVLPMEVKGDPSNPIKTILEITWASPSSGKG